jgi:hypothetical protein
MRGFKEVSGDNVQIGRNTFQVCRHDFRNGTTVSLEVGGGPRSGFTNILPIEDLQNIRVMDLPKGFSLDIYMPTLPKSPEIEGLSFKHVHGKGICSLSLGFVYAEWKNECNLALYSKEVAAKMLLELPNCFAVSVDNEDVGTRISCSLDIPTHVDLYQQSQELGLIVSNVLAPKKSTSSYRELLPALKPDEHGVRWWIRYVLIPIFGSATLLGLIRMFS